MAEPATCQCTDMWRVPWCIKNATQEDLLCDNCRENAACARSRAAYAQLQVLAQGATP